MTSEVKLNLMACLFIFLAIISVSIFISFDKKMGGNILNSKSYKSETLYYIADKNGNQKEVSEEIWNKCQKITIITFISVLLATISFLYLFCRYIFFPSLKNNLKILHTFFRK